jgi:hypothetical protein
MAQSSAGAGVVMGLAFAGIGSAGVYFAMQMYKKAQDTLSWPSALGEVTHADVHSHHHKKRTSYEAEVEYSYTVNGMQYISKKIAVMTANSNYGNAQAVVAKYPRQSRVTVYYDPANPADAVLEPGLSSGIYVVFGVSVLFALFGVFFLISALTGR